mgnify:CR=1 FL=1
MQDSHDKITIRREELVEPPPRRPITIQASDLPNDAPPPVPQEPALDAILVEHPRQPKMPAAAWIGLALVPVLNVWAFWHYAPADPNKRNLCRAAACLLAVGQLFIVGFAVAYLAWPRPDWIEQAASRADRAVVRIEARPDSMGTGFVISSIEDEHLLLISLHVVGTSRRCRVTSRLGRSARAKVVGYPKDDEVDLALVLVETHGLETMGRIGRFRDVRVGQAAVAIGHPLGLDYTVTSGIVSAKRDGRELQTSAPISPGNSGGPLIDRSGRVIGVNTRIIDPAAGQSLAFATRADLVLDADAWDFHQDIDDLLSRIPR